MPAHETGHNKLRMGIGEVHLVQTLPHTCVQKPGSIENRDAAGFRISITYISTGQGTTENA